MIPRPMQPTSIILLFLSMFCLCVDHLVRVPSKAFDGGCLRLVFAANPAAISNLIEISEQKRIVDLAGPGFVAAGIIGELDMGDTSEMFLQRWRDVTFHHLHVVNVILNEEVFGPDLGDDLRGLFCPVHEKTGNVASVDRFDQQLDALICENVSGETEIFNKYAKKFCRIGVSGCYTNQAIELAAVERLRIIDGALHSIAEFSHAAG